MSTTAKSNASGDMPRQRSPQSQAATTSQNHPSATKQQQYQQQHSGTAEPETLITIPPDGGWGWIVVVGAFWGFCIADGFLVCFGVFLNELAVAMNSTTSEIAIVGAIQTCCYCLVGPVAAALVNKFGYRFVSIVGTVIAAGAYVLTAITNEHYQLILTYGVISGTGFGMMYVAGVIAVGYYFERWRGLASGMSLCGSGIGGTCLPPLTTILLEKLGWRYTFYVKAALILTCIICGLVYRPLKPVKVPLISSRTGQKKSVSTISDRLESKKEISDFFQHYNNATYPTVADVQPSVIAVLKPPKVNATRSTSSEMIASTPLDGGEYIHHGGGISDDGTDYMSRWCCDCSYIRKRCYLQCYYCRKKSQSRIRLPSRPMYRDDIFFFGSIATLPEYKRSQQGFGTSSVRAKAALEYHKSVTRVTTPRDVKEETMCRLCPEAVKRTLATMLDTRLLKEKQFIYLVLNAVCVSYAFYTPYVYVKDRALRNGFPEEKAFWLISSIGVANTIGRVLCGVIAAIPGIKAHLVCFGLLLVAGGATVASGLLFEPWYQFTYTALYGLSGMSTLRTVIIVDTLGLEKLTNAVGMILLFQGLASFGGTSIAGLLRDYTGNYYATFYLSGSMLVMASLFLVLLKTKPRGSPDGTEAGDSQVTDT